eukprot:NODE_208_length_14728_cov_0.400164.p11 type:complete len:148 gc:universal NODE_208_length_14728_cov_0.400164:10626-10183(-)
MTILYTQPPKMFFLFAVRFTPVYILSQSMSLISDLKKTIQSATFTMYTFYGQAEHSTLFEPRKGNRVCVEGEPLTIKEESAKEFGNRTKKYKSIGRKPGVLDPQPKAEYYRKRKILREGQVIDSESHTSKPEDKTDTPASQYTSIND